MPRLRTKNPRPRSKLSILRKLLGGALAGLWFAMAPIGALGQEDCQTCHGEAEFAVEDDHGNLRSLFVDPAVLENSVHAGFECVMCHEQAAEIPHPESMTAPACGMCHEDAVSEMSQSIHVTSGAGEDAPSCADCHGKHDIRTVSDSLSWVNPHNQAQTCGRCHANPQLVDRYRIPAKDPIKAYANSVHGRVTMTPGLYPDLVQKMAAGQLARAATCSDCHGGHKILPAKDQASTVFYRNIVNTCGNCHADIKREFEQSVHGVALVNGARDAPVCTDCHGEHTIEVVTASTSPVAPQNVARETCGRCHASTRIAERYGLNANQVASFQNSYHGLALRSGRLTVANCASCHGVHNILPSSDPRSMINLNNLAATCGQCHQGAGAEFARNKVHLMDADAGAHIVEIIRNIYIALIVVVIGFMIIHNGLDFYRKSKHVLRHR